MEKSKLTLKKSMKIGCGTILLLVFIFVAWVWLGLFTGPGANKINDYHPFKSPRARERYLAHYDRRSQEWPVTFEDRFVPTSDGTTFVRISGPQAAPPLVLLPSASANTLIWLPNVAALSQDFRVYAVDNIYDFGRSIYLREFKTPEDFTTWLDELFSGLGLDNEINLAGLSYGGWLTGQYALRYPERLNKIVLMAPVATVQQLPLEWAKVAIKALLPHRYFMRQMVEWMFPALIQTPEGRATAETMLEDAYLGLRCFKLKMTVTPTVLTDAELGQLQNVPALYMVGDREVIYDPNAALERLRRVAPKIRTLLVPGAGHDLTIVRADLVDSKIVEFLQR
ncbi:MAG: alpha/beta hydrolase [Candidatus Neomarinimicrobiota bacterium]